MFQFAEGPRRSWNAHWGNQASFPPADDDATHAHHAFHTPHDSAESVCYTFSDGESKIATTVTGPWSETYDVHESITIEVGDTTAVTVTENGTQRQFDSKTSGIGTITIQSTPEAKTTSTDANQQGSSDDNANQGDNSSNETSQDNENNNNNSSQHDTGEDEYLYNYNGYDIYYSSEEDLYYFFDESGQRINAQDGTPA